MPASGITHRQIETGVAQLQGWQPGRTPAQSIVHANMFQVLMFCAVLRALWTCLRARVGETSQYSGMMATAVSTSRMSWRCHSIRWGMGTLTFSCSRIASTHGLL